ncbi:MAG: CpaF family protein [Acidimicrobiales bacterium]
MGAVGVIETAMVDELVAEAADALEAESARRGEQGLRPLDATAQEALAVARIRQRLDEIDGSRLRSGIQRLSPAVEEGLIERVLAHVIGLGPIEILLADPTVEEITASRWDLVHVYRSDGTVEQLTEPLWGSESELAIWLAHLARTKGRTERQFNPQSPLLVMRLGSGLRLAAHRDVSQHIGFALRRNTLGRITLGRLVELGMMPPVVADLLRAAVASGQTRMVFAGATSSGKSTTARACLAELPPLSHVIVIEDTAELDLFDPGRHPNVESWEQREPNAEGEGAITQGALVTHALRARPDWLVCGEVRDSDAAVPMVKAMTQGQASLTTVHAPSAVAAIDKLALYLGTGEDRLPIAVAHHQLSLAIDFVVHLSQIGDGHRQVTEVVEVAGFDGERCTVNRVYRHGPDEIAQGFARLSTPRARMLGRAGFDARALAWTGSRA